MATVNLEKSITSHYKLYQQKLLLAHYFSEGGGPKFLTPLFPLPPPAPSTHTCILSLLTPKIEHDGLLCH